MRQVIKKLEILPVVSLDRVNPSKYYGYIINISQRGFIQNIRDTWHPANAKGINEGKAFGAADSASLSKTIEILLSWNSQVFEFDTHKELFQWILEE